MGMGDVQGSRGEWQLLAPTFTRPHRHSASATAPPRLAATVQTITRALPAGGFGTKLSRVAQDVAQSVAKQSAGAPGKRYPFPTSPGVTANMKANRRTNTKPELALRTALHAMGYRYRKDHRLDLPLRRVRPDIAFTRRKVAVFVDGCFWHACPDHGSKPKSNEWYWSPKLAKNVERDRAADEALAQAGWTVIRLWEHVPLADAVALVVHTVGEPKSLR